jgi:hypothetical protein
MATQNCIIILLNMTRVRRHLNLKL